MQARKSLLIFLTNGVGAVLGILSLFFIGRYMAPAVLGMYGFAYSVLRIVSQLSDLGMDNAHIKRVSEGQDLGNCFTTFAYVKVVMVVAMTLIVVGAAFAWDHFRGFFDATSLGVILVVAAYFFVFQLNRIFVDTYNALRYTAKTQLMALAENVVKTPVIVAAALIFGFFASGRWIPFEDAVAGLIEFLHITGPWSNATGATAIGLGHLVGIIASLIVGIGLFFYHRYPVGRYDHELFRSYLRFALPIAAISIVGIILRRVDTVMLGYFWSATDVGYYFASERIITMVLVIPNAIAILFFPLISQLASRGDKDAVNEVSISTQRMISLVVAPMGMIGIVYAPEAIHIFLSDSWLPATNTLRFMIVFVVLQSFVIVSRNIIMGFDRPIVTTKISMLMLTSNLVLNTLLIPDSILGVPLFGLRSTGAAIATAAAQGLGLVLLLLAARRLTGRLTVGRRVTKHFVAAIAVGAFLWSTKGLPFFGGLDRWYELGMAGALGGILYLAVLVALREVTRKDLHLVLDTFHPMRMVRYIKHEITDRRDQR